MSHDDDRGAAAAAAAAVVVVVYPSLSLYGLFRGPCRCDGRGFVAAAVVGNLVVMSCPKLPQLHTRKAGVAVKKTESHLAPTNPESFSLVCAKNQDRSVT